MTHKLAPRKTPKEKIIANDPNSNQRANGVQMPLFSPVIWQCKQGSFCEAGGAVSNGKENILDIQPAAISQVTPVYIGGKNEIALIEKFMHEG